MTLGYRSYLQVDADESLIETVVGRISSWQQEAEFDGDAAVPGRYAQRSGDVITVVRDENDDECLYRWRRIHPDASEHAAWRTTLTAGERADGGGWLRAEVEPAEVPSGPWRRGRGAMMPVPEILAPLLDELCCRDGRTPVSAHPRWLDPDRLPDVMDDLADESRRGAILVASSAYWERDDLEAWAEQVLAESVGLCTMYLLGTDVEAEFNEMVGSAHAVGPGTVRTYAPNVTLDQPDDPYRHRILGAGRIHDDPVHRIASMLGTALRHRTWRQPLPPHVIDVEHQLDCCADGLASHAASTPHAVSTPPSRPMPDTETRTKPTPVVALRRENAQLRAQVEALTDMVRHYQRSESAMLTAVEKLQAEIRELRRQLLTRQPDDTGDRSNGLREFSVP